LFHCECVYVMNVMCEFIVFSDLIMMNLFYCKMGDHHQMRVSTGFVLVARHL